MKIQVRPKHIREGRRGNVLSCPIALALRAAGLGGVSVGRTHANTSIPGKDTKWELPESVTRFIDAFDLRDGRPVPIEPFTFEMERV